MHYHVLLIDDDGEHVDDVVTFARQEEAEERAAAAVLEIGGPGWQASRYPGRTWRPQEVAVYLDRRPFERGVPRLELTIIRCNSRNGEHGPGCWLYHRGLQW